MYKTKKHNLLFIIHNSVKPKGFTLVELLVVMSIIGVLASLAVGSFRNAQTRGRDATRKSDLKQIAHSLELFYADYGRYPSATGTMIAGCPFDPTLQTGTACSWGSGSFSDGKTAYFKTLPNDPSSNQNYEYRIIAGSNNQKFQLFAKLENPEDPDCIEENCNQIPNFAVTSANTSATE